jgi:hypothetical protein
MRVSSHALQNIAFIVKPIKRSASTIVGYLVDALRLSTLQAA